MRSESKKNSVGGGASWSNGVGGGGGAGGLQRLYTESWGGGWAVHPTLQQQTWQNRLWPG